MVGPDKNFPRSLAKSVADGRNLNFPMARHHYIENRRKFNPFSNLQSASHSLANSGFRIIVGFLLHIWLSVFNA